MNIEQNLLLNLDFNSKSQIQESLNKVLDSVENGESDALKLRVEATKLQELAKSILANKELLDLALNEAEQFTKNEKIVISGATIQVKESGVRYDYKNTPIYSEKKALFNDTLKEIEQLAKITKTQTTWIDSETGEQHIVKPAIKYSKTTTAITLAKE